MAHEPPPRANHARYLVVLALGSFALPLVARMAEAFGAPRTPAGVTALLLAATLITAILVDNRPQDDPAMSGVLPAESEDPRARL